MALQAASDDSTYAPDGGVISRRLTTSQLSEPVPPAIKTVDIGWLLGGRAHVLLLLR
jgi:hypothetical protein